MVEKCQRQSGNHGHKPGECKEKATEHDRVCKPCHNKAARSGTEGGKAG